MNSLLFTPIRITILCFLSLFLTSNNAYSQIERVKVVPTGSRKYPEDAISLTFRAPKDKNSLFEIEVLEFKNKKGTKKEQRWVYHKRSVDLTPESILLFKVYETDNDIVFPVDDHVMVMVRLVDGDGFGRLIKPVGREKLKCVSLGSHEEMDIYGKTVAFALVFDGAKVEKKDIEARLADIPSAEKSDVEKIREKIREKMSNILEHYYIVTYSKWYTTDE